MVGFTDDRLKLYDIRSKSDNIDFILEDGHTDIVWSLRITNDGMICYSVGCDSTLRVWDIS